MIDDTIQRIEARIRGAEGIAAERKEELLRLIGTLKTEVSGLSQTHADHAQTIVGFTQVSTHEATRQPRRPHLLSLSLEALESSVKEFETSHPKLVHIVNTISTTLSNLGI